MIRDLVDTAGYYQLSHSDGRLADDCRLRFDRGTLLLEGMNRLPPGWIWPRPRVCCTLLCICL